MCVCGCVCDCVKEMECERLRARAEGALRRHSYRSAVFLADALVSLSGGVCFPPTHTHKHTHTHTHTNGHHSCVYMTPGTVFASACSSFLGCVSTREKYTHTHVCVCVCAGAVENVVFFAEVLFADGQYERALEVIQGRELERQDLRALLLAARCLVCVSVPLGVQNKKRKKQCGDAYCLS